MMGKTGYVPHQRFLYLFRHTHGVFVSTGQVGLVAGLLFAFLVVLPAVLLLFCCYRIKTSYYHKWLSQRKKNKNNKYCVHFVHMSFRVIFVKLDERHHRQEWSGIAYTVQIIVYCMCGSGLIWVIHRSLGFIPCSSFMDVQVPSGQTLSGLSSQLPRSVHVTGWITGILTSMVKGKVLAIVI